MAPCASCCEEVADVNTSISCKGGCQKCFHINCISTDIKKMTKKEKKNWKCDNCSQSNSPTGNGPNASPEKTPNEEKPVLVNPSNGPATVNQETVTIPKANEAKGNEAMKNLIQVINKLQEVFSSAGLSLEKFHLPQIAVVGGQSAGKSSVLENFIGRDFLPRGSDIVTRCPLVMQLIPDKEEYAVFGHLDKKFYDFEEVKVEIESRTSFLTEGKMKAITDKPIMLRIYSPNVVELTVVDLPGLTKVPVGDQPADIGIQIRNLVLQYISNENTLILAVSPANNDIANSDALQLSKEVDPEGKRTFGVITKLDLMDAGTDAKSILDNTLYPLQRGYVGLVNRSQMDINKRKDIKTAQEDEMKFIKSHPAYKKMAERMGSRYLQNLLSKSLGEHILKKLPELKESLRRQRDETKRELKNYSDYDGSEVMAGRIIHELISTFSREANMQINGHSLEMRNDDLSTGAKIIEKFCFEFPPILAREQRAFKQRDLLLMIANQRGLRYGQFVPEEILEVCIQRLIEVYESPSNDCIDSIGELLKEMLLSLCQKTQRYVKLEEELTNLCYQKVDDFVEETKKTIHIFIESQGAFINTRHPDFKSIASVEDIPPEYYKEIDVYWKKENPNTAIPTFFPSVNLKATQKNKIIHESIVHLRSERELLGHFQLLLSNYYLAFYLEEKEKKLQHFLGKIKNESLEIEDDGRPAELRLRTTHKILPCGGKQVDLQFTNDSEKTIWLNSFRQTHVRMKKTENKIPIPLIPNLEEEEEELVYSEDEDTSKIKLKIDQNLQEQLEIIAYMVDTYMKIIHKAVADILLKFIRNLLVNKLVEYLANDLLHCLEGKHQELLETSPEETNKKKELEKIYRATDKALITLSLASNDISKIDKRSN